MTAKGDIVGKFGPQLKTPHDLAISSNCDTLYVGEIDPYIAWKFQLSKLNKIINFELLISSKQKSEKCFFKRKVHISSALNPNLHLRLIHSLTANGVSFSAITAVITYPMTSSNNSGPTMDLEASNLSILFIQLLLSIIPISLVTYTKRTSLPIDSCKTFLYKLEVQGIKT